jgi:hypothetical protein
VPRPALPQRAGLDHDRPCRRWRTPARWSRRSDRRRRSLRPCRGRRAGGRVPRFASRRQSMGTDRIESAWPMHFPLLGTLARTTQAPPACRSPVPGTRPGERTRANMAGMRKALRLVLLLCAVLAMLVAGGAWWGYGRLKASLPVLDGERPLSGLGGRVTVERDRLGIPTIKGGSRRDVARATGSPRAGPVLPDGPDAGARGRAVRAGGRTGRHGRHACGGTGCARGARSREPDGGRRSRCPGCLCRRRQRRTGGAERDALRVSVLGSPRNPGWPKTACS